MQNLFIVIVTVTALISVVIAEPPTTGYSSPSTRSLSGIVDKNLLNKVADILEKGGNENDYEHSTNEGDQLVDPELLGRIAQIINQNEGSVGRNAPKPLETIGLPSENYGAPPQPSKTYSGVEIPPPSKIFENSGPIELGRPQIARRIASFDIEDNDEGLHGIQVPSTNTYSLPSFGRSSYYTAPSSRAFELGEPEAAERIASFDIQGSPYSARESYRPPQARGSYY